MDVPGSSCGGVYRVCENRVSPEWQAREVLWEARGQPDVGARRHHGAKFVEALREGDRIAVWARSQVSYFTFSFIVLKPYKR